jgi:hypothetical protein
MMFLADDNIIFKAELRDLYGPVDGELEYTGFLSTILDLQYLFVPDVYTDQLHSINSFAFLNCHLTLVRMSCGLTSLHLHFLNGDEFKSQGPDLWDDGIHDLGHPPSMSMSIVQDDHRARDSSLHDLADRPADRLHPVWRQATPHHQAKSPFLELEPGPGSKDAIGRPQVPDRGWGQLCCICDGIPCAFQSRMKCCFCFKWKGNMAVAVQGELVPALVDLPGQVRVALDTFSHQVEGGAHFVPFQHLEQARRIYWVRTIVERQRDLAAGSITLIEDLRVAALSSLIITLEIGGKDIHGSVSQLYVIYRDGHVV